MARRTWITVKRGILEPKHRFALGELIWLFMYILDITNWEAGTIEEWSDKGVAEDMDMPLPTLIDQRRKLQEKGYITCERKQHGIRVIVHNWTNPREYTGKKYNEKVPSDTPINTPVNTLVNTPSDTPINTPIIKNTARNILPSYNQKSQIKSHKSQIINTAPANFSDSRPVIETNYAVIWSSITGMPGIPQSDMPKVITAIDTLRPRYKSEGELIAYLKPYYDYWLTKKTKDGRAYSKSNCAWLYDLAVAGDPLPQDKRTVKKPDPDCPKCKGLGMYSAGITDVKDKRFGSLIPCDCLQEVSA